jgi:hypothetical protein
MSFHATVNPLEQKDGGRIVGFHGVQPNLQAKYRIAGFVNPAGAARATARRGLCQNVKFIIESCLPMVARVKAF